MDVSLHACVYYWRRVGVLMGNRTFTYWGNDDEPG